MTRTSDNSRAELREPVRPALRERRRTRSVGTSPFDLDTSIVPDGMTYEFKRVTTIGQQDTSHQMDLAANGWEPVPASRHPGLMPAGYEGPIVIGDQMLMDRPVELTLEARREHEALTNDHMNANQRQLSEPMLKGTNAPRLGKGISTSFAPVDVPE